MLTSCEKHQNVSIHNASILSRQWTESYCLVTDPGKDDHSQWSTHPNVLYNLNTPIRKHKQ